MGTRVELWGDSLTEGTPGVSYVEMLKQRRPEIEWVNYGRGGDTLYSLLIRLRGTRLERKANAAFVWIGINEIFQQLHWHYPLLAFVRGQRASKDLLRQGAIFESILDMLSARAGLVTVGLPHLFGEQIDSEWNCSVRRLGKQLRKVASDHQDIPVIDLHARFAAALENQAVSDYLPRSLGQVGMDVLQLNSDNAADKVAANRGLHLTLDGVHLNSAGARIVADAVEAALLSLQTK